MRSLRLLAIVGLLLAGCGGNVPDDVVQEVEVGPLALLDHFRLDVAFWDCDGYVSELPEFDDPTGIDSPEPGVIRASPTAEKVSRLGANVGVWMDNAGLALSDAAMELPNGDIRVTGDLCGDSEGELVALVWDDRSEPPMRRIREGLRDVVLYPDGALIVLAFARKDLAVPVPGSDDVAVATTVQESTTTTTVPPRVEPTGPIRGEIRQSVFFSSTPCSVRQRPVGSRCLRIGDESVTNFDVVSAEVIPVEETDGSSSSGVRITFDRAGGAAFNELAAACAARVEPCRVGEIAVLVDDEVVALFAIEQESYGPGELVLQGDYSESLATAIAEAFGPEG